MGTSPILLHNVPIRDSRHCGSVHHLAPATSTPGERAIERGAEIEAIDREGVKKEEIGQCIISPSVIAICLYRGHGQLHLCTAEQIKSEKEIKGEKKNIGMQKAGVGG